MTKLVVKSGSCGYNINIVVEKEAGGSKRFRLHIESDCKHVNLLASDLPVLDMAAVFTAIIQNPVYQAGSRRLKHPACPVPSAILKALEVEAALNVPRDVHIEFEKKRD
ncbi:MAG: hypothetical protein ABSG42_03080 [Nitrospirota bacterium]